MHSVHMLCQLQAKTSNAIKRRVHGTASDESRQNRRMVVWYNACVNTRLYKLHKYHNRNRLGDISECISWVEMAPLGVYVDQNIPGYFQG